jgi:hypothetical protein
MPAKFDALSEQQKADFWARVKKWGLTPADVHPELDTREIGPQTFISGSDPGSHVKTKPFTITSVEHMKSLVGIPDESFASGKMRDRTVNYPQALPDHRTQLLAQAPNLCWLKDRLTEDEHEDVRNSWLAYLVGNSQKISAPMVDMINAVHFPALGAVAAVQNINVAPGTTHTFGTPGDKVMQTIVIGVLTIQPGGSIAFASPCALEIQQTVVGAAQAVHAMAISENALAVGDADTNNIRIYTPKPEPPVTPPPQPAKPQANSAYGGVADTKRCTAVSSTATPGDTGTPGSTGTNGSPAISPPPVIACLGEVTGTYNFLAGGGNAQDGGQGGQGGTGGQGGDGVKGAGGFCSNQGPAKGGQGGTGGTGGIPGNGASGSTSYFYYKSIKQPFSYNIQTVGGYGGQPGGWGLPGAGGAGGADPAGVMPSPYVPANYTNGPGGNGAAGNNGNPGTNGNPGVIYFQQKS